MTVVSPASRSFRLQTEIVSPTLDSKIFCEDRWTLPPTESRGVVFENISNWIHRKIVAKIDLSDFICSWFNRFQKTRNKHVAFEEKCQWKQKLVWKNWDSEKLGVKLQCLTEEMTFGSSCKFDHISLCQTFKLNNQQTNLFSCLLASHNGDMCVTVLKYTGAPNETFSETDVTNNP